jgi:hypothetical protein
MNSSVRVALVASTISGVCGIATGIYLGAAAHADPLDGLTGEQRYLQWERLETRKALAGPQPDTAAPNWRPISEDVGVWLTSGDRNDLRGRLYVRQHGLWWPVGVEGAPGGVFPAN